MMNRYTATVESCDRAGTYAWLTLDQGRLAASLWPGIKTGARVAVRIRPEEVMLSIGHPGRISARNILPGHVRSIKFVPEGAYVTLDVGFELTAMVMLVAVNQLKIRRGAALFAIVKATAVIPEAKEPCRYKVSLVGARGDVSPREISFLRAIDQTGSISAAAREIGITYRTAWLWVRTVNRVWGAPLVARVHGGHGGGGAALTPEGRAALSFAESLEARSASGKQPRRNG
jgi:molybdate transport repressor ModE-like protein/molybdopterin-binding protein